MIVQCIQILRLPLDALNECNGATTYRFAALLAFRKVVLPVSHCGVCLRLRVSGSGVRTAARSTKLRVGGEAGDCGRQIWPRSRGRDLRMQWPSPAAEGPGVGSLSSAKGSWRS